MKTKYATLRYEVADCVATVTLNRPDKLNAFTVGMMQELLQVFDEIDSDDNVRVVVVTGAGRAFCAGADLSAGESTFDLGVADPSLVRADGTLDYTAEAGRDGGGRVALRIFRCLKPVIAAINGAAVGVGITMTLPMDIRLASDRAKIGFVFARRGLVPEAASTWFLPRVVGISRALEWCCSGRLLEAREALAGGLVREVCSPEQLLPAAYTLAREIAANAAPVSVALLRQMLWRGLGMDDPMEAHKVDSRALLVRGRSADVLEGVNSFFEKRSPHFTDSVSKHMPDFFPWWRERPYS